MVSPNTFYPREGKKMAYINAKSNGFLGVSQLVQLEIYRAEDETKELILTVTLSPETSVSVQESPRARVTEVSAQFSVRPLELEHSEAVSIGPSEVYGFPLGPGLPCPRQSTGLQLLSTVMPKDGARRS